MMGQKRYLLVLAALGMLGGCAAQSAAPAGGSLVNREWELVSLGRQGAALGVGQRPVTLHVDAVAGRASGFSGCNRYSAGYELSGDALRFTAPLSTRMACAGGMELEQGFLAMLPQVARYQVVGATLTLSSKAGVLATFRAP